MSPEHEFKTINVVVFVGHDKAFQCEMDVCADSAVLYAFFWSKINCLVVGFISYAACVSCQVAPSRPPESWVAPLGTVELGTWIEAISFRSLQSFKGLREIGQKRYIRSDIFDIGRRINKSPLTMPVLQGCEAALGG